MPECAAAALIAIQAPKAGWNVGGCYRLTSGMGGELLHPLSSPL